MTSESSLMDELYQIESVQPADPPQDMEGSNWFCYIIVQGTNTIRGYRQGKIGAVTDAVEELVGQLN